jgi:hypothetical protein
VSDDDIGRLTAYLGQEPSQREKTEKLFRDVLRAAGEFKTRATQQSVGAGEVMVELEKLEEALLFFKGIANKYYDVLHQLLRLMQERKVAPALALRLLEKRAAARTETH